MLTRKPLLTGTLAVVAVAGVLVATGHRAHGQPSTLFGLHQDLDYFGQSAPQRVTVGASVGTQVSRNTLLWRDHEPADAQFDWSGSDLVQQELAAAGVQSLWVIGCAPSWANGSGDCYDTPSYPSAAFDAWRDQAAEFAAAAAARYPGGMWEVWNEPNEIFFWTEPNREAYSDLYRTVRAAMLAADPTAKVAVGGITGLNASCVPSGCIQGAEFITDMLANGDPIDYLGIHPYAGSDQAPNECIDFERNFRDVALIQQILDDNGNDAELWLTEWGWSSSTIGEASQAQYLTEASQMIASGTMDLCPQHGGGQVQPNVTVSTWFFDIDTTDFPRSGIFRADFSRKPAADAFEEFLGGTATRRES